jgi:hypothetical protein
MKFKTVGIARAVLAVLATCAPSWAGIITESTNSGIFLGANPGITSMDFARATNSIAYAGGATTLTVPSFSPTFLGLYNDAASVNATMWIDGGTTNPHYNFSSGGIMVGGAASISGTNSPNTGLRTTFSAAPGTRAIGFNYATIYDNGPSTTYPTTGTMLLRVVDSSGTHTRNLAMPTVAQTMAYFGFTTDADIIRIELLTTVPMSQQNGRVVMDNLSFGAAAPTSGGGGGGGGELPEPSTYLISAAGLLLLVALRKRVR